MPDWSGFYKRPLADRIALVAEFGHLDGAERDALAAGLTPGDAQAFVENVVGTFPLPLGVAVGFEVDGEATVVPMAVEESSVVAAASHGAKLAAVGGGFRTDVDDPIAIGQIEVRDVADPKAAIGAVDKEAATWLTDCNQRIRSMVERGGGVRDIHGRDLGEGRVVVHLHVDTCDAMGANLVNGLCEFLGPRVAEALGGTRGLRILSNLATERLVTAHCRVPLDALARDGASGADVAAAMVAADDFARVDPYRAATHNKGIMNGIDPVLVATGNDWRAVEAGAHAYAARDGTYRGLTRYRMAGDALEAELTLPLALGTVGGVTRLHPTARACLKIIGGGRPVDGRRLAAVVASVGLAQNLAALRALASEGIQAGHMALHARNLAMQAGAAGDDVARVAGAMVAEGAVTVRRAREILGDGHSKA